MEAREKNYSPVDNHVESLVSLEYKSKSPSHIFASE